MNHFAALPNKQQIKLKLASQSLSPCSSKLVKGTSQIDMNLNSAWDQEIYEDMDEQASSWAEEEGSQLVK